MQSPRSSTWVPDLADKFTGKDKDDANTADDIEHILNQEEKKQGE